MKPTLRRDRRSSTLVHIVLLGTALLSASSAGAQISKTWYGHIAAGFATAQGDAGDVLDDGYSFSGGITWRPEGRRIGVMTELGYHTFDVDSAVAESLGASRGDVDILSFTVGPTWVFQNDGKVGFQISTGAGLYDLTGELTEPGFFVGICNPWFWWCYPGLVPGDIIVDRASTTRFGWNVGIGVTFDVGINKQIFLEARYHRVETKTTTEFIPLTIGYRW